MPIERKPPTKSRVKSLRRKCRQKKAYATMAGAIAHAKLLRETDPDEAGVPDRMKAAPYRCPYCDCWHVGHPKR